MEKRTILEKIEIEVATGRVFMRFKKQIVDGENIIELGFHRSVVEPGTDVDEQMAHVNSSLVSMNAAPVDVSQIDALKQHTVVAHTEEKVEMFAEMRRVEAAKLAADQAAEAARVAEANNGNGK